MKTIAVDIDDVLALNAQGFIEFSNREFATNLQISDYKEHWADMWQVDFEETERRARVFHESKIVASYQHIKESVFVLDALKDKFHLVIVTSRRNVLKDSTRAWLDTYFNGMFERIYFAGIYDGPLTKGSYVKTKAEVFKEILPDYVIDDQIKHCQAAIELGIDAVLFGNYSWNNAEELPLGMVRCKDWNEVGRYFENK